MLAPNMTTLPRSEERATSNMAPVFGDRKMPRPKDNCTYDEVRIDPATWPR